MKSKSGNIPVTNGNIGPELVTFSAKNPYLKSFYEEMGEVIRPLIIGQTIDYDVPEFNLPRIQCIFYKAAKHYRMKITIKRTPELLIITRLS